MFLVSPAVREDSFIVPPGKPMFEDVLNLGFIWVSRDAVKIPSNCGPENSAGEYCRARWIKSDRSHVIYMTMEIPIINKDCVA